MNPLFRVYMAYALCWTLQAAGQPLPQQADRDIQPGNSDGEWVDRIEGDLNADGLLDLVLVQAVEDTNEEGWRVLSVYIQKANAQYHLACESTTFLSIGDLKQAPILTITPRGLVQIDFQDLASETEYIRSTHSYRFHYREETLELWWFESATMDEATGQVEVFTMNFENQKMRHAVGSLIEAIDPIVEYQRYVLPERKTMKTLVRPLQWAFMGAKI